MSRYDLTDFEWRVIEPLLLNKPRGVPRVDDRQVLNDIVWVRRSGAPWRDLPERDGPRTTCYNRFVRRRQAGVWDRLMDAITAAYDRDIQMIDSTSVRAHQQAATAKRGSRSLSRSLPGRSHDQIHALVDRQGLPLRLGLTAGQAHDAPAALGLLDPRTIVLADKAYDGNAIRDLIEAQGAVPNIPAKSNRNFRRIATRYEKLADNFLSMVQFTSMRLWLRAYESTAQLARRSNGRQPKQGLALTLRSKQIRLRIVRSHDPHTYFCKVDSDSWPDSIRSNSCFRLPICG